MSPCQGPPQPGSQLYTPTPEKQTTQQILRSVRFDPPHQASGVITIRIKGTNSVSQTSHLSALSINYIAGFQGSAQIPDRTTDRKLQMKRLTQNMQDRQIQVRAGSARAAGKLREMDGMVTGRSDATAQWASVCIIQPEEASIAAES